MNQIKSILTPWGLAIVNLPRSNKIFIEAGFDCIASVITAVMVLSILTAESPYPAQITFETIAISLGLFMPIAVAFGFYRMVVRFIGWRSVLRIGLAFGVYFVLLLAAHLVLPKSISFPYAFVQPLILFCVLVGTRTVVRYALTHRMSQCTQEHLHQSRALIYGAGSAGRQLANSLIIDGKNYVVGFIDDNAELQGCNVNGLVVHAPSEIVRIIESSRVSDVYLAIPSLSRPKRQELLAKLSELSIAVKALPTLAEIINGKVYESDLRQVSIEEVLGRDPISPDVSLLRENIYGKVVLITGAGGSIGSEIARQVIRQCPRLIILFEQNEYALYTIENELADLCSREGRLKAFLPVLGSVTNADRLLHICDKFGVQTIYHAAAYKHVPLVETNPLMGICNNVVGTKRLVEVAERCRVETFVLISTDKAVRPTNIMGCTKRIAELILQAKQQMMDSDTGTKFTMVRFGNVLGSSGSVIPAFRAQIEAGGPVRVTHPEIVRYFMTITEAAQLVIQAGALGSGGDVMVLDMGEPIKIRDLAEQMIHLSGLRVKNADDPEGTIEIVYTGLRPGEKLYEELLIGENTSKTRHPRICLAREKMLPWDLLEPKLKQLEDAIIKMDSDLARLIIKEIVPEFVPQCDNQDWLVMHHETQFETVPHRL